MKITKISWTDSTVNFWIGCIKISLGCKFCYMFRDMAMYGKNPNNITRTSDKTFYAALKWMESKKIFTNSWSDFFIEEADAWRNDAWDVIRKTPQHNWLILTKRPERILKCLPEDWGQGWNNVWLGVTVENQEAADKRIPLLLEVPAKIKFLSCEPLLEKVDVSKYLHGIQWNIIGGESGNNTGKYLYRECQMEWIESLIDQSKKAGVATFVKQLGTYIQKEMGLKTRHAENIEEFPKEVQLREFPKNVNPNFIEKRIEQEEITENPMVKNIQTEKEGISIQNHESAKEYVDSLSPFKKEIGLAILAGQAPNEVAVKFATERNKPLKTYQAYVTMVRKGLEDVADCIKGPEEGKGTPKNVQNKIIESAKEISFVKEERQMLVKSLSIIKLANTDEGVINQIDALINKIEN